MPSLGVFCGALGWLVVAQAAWLHPLLPEAGDADAACLITQADVTELRCAVATDDGYVYDARALREWLRRCAAESRSPCVIPGKDISTVWPVRSSPHAHLRLHVPPANALTLAPTAPPTRPMTLTPTLRSVATQTEDRPPKKRPRPPVRIPSEHSAFRTVCAKGVATPCARR